MWYNGQRKTESYGIQYEARENQGDLLCNTCRLVLRRQYAMLKTALKNGSVNADGGISLPWGGRRHRRILSLSYTEYRKVNDALKGRFALHNRDDRLGYHCSDPLDAWAKTHRFGKCLFVEYFEIVATTVIAFVVFKEAVSKKLWVAIALVTLSSMVLSFEDLSALRFSWGSLSVLAAAACWGLENNCTRKISAKNTYEIVTIKGVCSGLGSLAIGLVIGEKIPAVRYVLIVMLLGFVAYGLSILFYIKAQKELGAAKTSAYYAIAPFAGAFLSFLFLKEPFSIQFFIALWFMLLGSIIATIDTLRMQHSHTHSFTHTHDGCTHTHEIEHAHGHGHFKDEGNHEHLHLGRH